MTLAPHTLGAREALAMMDAGTLSAEALIRSCLERIEARESEVGAFQHLDPERAVAAARARDARREGGRLEGVPVGIKDIFDTIDMPTEYGSPIYRGFQPRRDATPVALLRQAGAVLPGKTTTTEFAGLQPTATKNPRNLGHTPGGSSAGSAAAVADDMVPLAIGSQTGGSVIRPAAFCGVVGIKPSFGLIDRTGVRPAAETLDTVGTFSRTVADGALLLSVLAKDAALAVDEHRFFKPRIGICRTLQWDDADHDTQAVIEAAALDFDGAGAVVADFNLPASFEGLLSAQAAIFTSGTLNSTCSELLHSPELISAETIALCEAGKSVSAADLRSAQDHLNRAFVDLHNAMEAFDILITPSAIGEAPFGFATTGDALFNKLWTALKVPAVNLPYGCGSNGLPIGLQVIGRFGGDAAALAAAGWLEQTTEKIRGRQ